MFGTKGRDLCAGTVLSLACISFGGCSSDPTPLPAEPLDWRAAQMLDRAVMKAQFDGNSATVSGAWPAANVHDAFERQYSDLRVVSARGEGDLSRHVLRLEFERK